MAIGYSLKIIELKDFPAALAGIRYNAQRYFLLGALISIKITL